MRRAIGPVVVAALVLSAARAADTVDLEIGPRDRAKGTLRPADERETFPVSATRGAKVKAVLKRTGRGGPVPSLELLEPGGGLHRAGTPYAKGSKLARVVLPEGGLWKFRVTGDGVLDGDYQLDVAITPQASWAYSAPAPVDPGAEASFSFAAPTAAVASIELRAAGGGFAPRLLDVTGPGGVIATAGAPASARVHKLARVAVRAPGEHTVRFRNDGAAAGTWTASVRLKTVKSRRSTADVRDEALAGEFAGDQAVFGRIATPEAGALLEGPEGTNLAGVSIYVPPGAIDVPTVVGMSEAEEFFAGDSANRAGSTIRFSPAGTRFAPDATVTVAYDPQAFDDPQSELAIVVEDEETGEQETIPPTSVDTASSAATFPASHFSRFQPTSPQPRSLRGNFVDLELSGIAEPDFGGRVTLGLNAVQGMKGPRAQHGLVRDVRRLTVGWGPDKAGVPSLFVVPDERSVSGLVKVQSNDSVLLENTAGDVQLSRGRSGDLLATSGALPFGTGVRASVVLRRAPGAPTRGNLVGAWHARVWQFEAHGDGDGVTLRQASQELEIVVAPDGAVTALRADLRSATTDFGVTPWSTSGSAQRPAPGTLDPSGGAATLSLALAGAAAPSPVALIPAVRGDVLVGGDLVFGPDALTPKDALLRLVVLVRVRPDARPEDVVGRSLFTTFGMTPVNTASGQARMEFLVTKGDLGLDGDLTFTLKGVRRVATHDATGQAVLLSPDPAGSGQWRVTGDGRLPLSKPAPEALLLRGSGGVVLDAGPTTVFGVLLGARPIP